MGENTKNGIGKDSFPLSAFHLIILVAQTLFCLDPKRHGMHVQGYFVPGNHLLPYQSFRNISQQKQLLIGSLSQSPF